MNNRQEAIQAAVDWWAKYVEGDRAPQRVGLEGDGGLMFIMNAAQSDRKSEEGSPEALKFRKVMTEYLDGELARIDKIFTDKPYHCTISTDYGPDHELANIMQESGVRCSFPGKTMMWIHTDDKVSVASGYQASSVQIYPRIDPETT